MLHKVWNHVEKCQYYKETVVGTLSWLHFYAHRLQMWTVSSFWVVTKLVLNWKIEFSFANNYFCSSRLECLWWFSFLWEMVRRPTKGKSVRAAPLENVAAKISQIPSILKFCSLLKFCFENFIFGRRAKEESGTAWRYGTRLAAAKRTRKTTRERQWAGFDFETHRKFE